jgi:hypothetical protein
MHSTATPRIDSWVIDTYLRLCGQSNQDRRLWRHHQGVMKLNRVLDAGANSSDGFQIASPCWNRVPWKCKPSPLPGDTNLSVKVLAELGNLSTMQVWFPILLQWMIGELTG